MARVVNWNGKDLPEELRGLPAGRYVLELLEDDADLTEEDEAGLRAALASLRAGEGRAADAVRQTLEDALKP